jgi:hypothetical protein
VFAGERVDRSADVGIIAATGSDGLDLKPQTLSRLGIQESEGSVRAEALRAGRRRLRLRDAANRRMAGREGCCKRRCDCRHSHVMHG